jgi:hypothetical protein
MAQPAKFSVSGARRHARRFLFYVSLAAVLFSFDASTASAQVGPYADNTPEVVRWMAERARRSRAGRPERVRIPLARKSTGWGCICPDYYVGLSTATTGGSTWVEPRFTRPTARPSRNVIVVAFGYFTGGRVTRDLRNSSGEPEEWIYQLWEFRVTRVRLLPEGHEFYDEDSPLNRVAVLRRRR